MELKDFGDSKKSLIEIDSEGQLQRLELLLLDKSITRPLEYSLGVSLLSAIYGAPSIISDMLNGSDPFVSHMAIPYAVALGTCIVVPAVIGTYRLLTRRRLNNLVDDINRATPPTSFFDYRQDYDYSEEDDE